ncbi:MAG: sigma factor [Eubacteriales bacterium]|nr:sigma factor [Eubacteriales bacterium]
MNEEQKERMERLYIEMYDKLMAYARSNLDNESLAEEAVQETFRIACQKYGKLFDSPNPHGWLVLTLRHTIQNMKKQCLNDKVLLSQYLAVQARNISFSEDMLSLDVQYGKIADTEEFKIIKEMAVDGYSHLELAQARGITVNACKKRVQRSKELLQKKLKK